MAIQSIRKVHSMNGFFFLVLLADGREYAVKADDRKQARQIAMQKLGLI